MDKHSAPSNQTIPLDECEQLQFSFQANFFQALCSYALLLPRNLV